ncbi:nuclear transport factor 2 family protein [Jejudonia soesokkakensis]|uniref:Nuclear transport factor 2 family protein n=1 Tax=Jejudonia soesokkakensis TaxID=1323432 RepID=A0ABW2MRN3_9FLAO
MEESNIIEQFYEAFGELDAERMVEWYHPDITFEDPVFGILKGERAKNMWRMVCESQKGKNFTVKASNIQYNKSTGTARWDEFYTFGKEGRKVHNCINARFTFKEGKIINHIDTFNLYRWSKQATGLKGFLVGWTAFFKKKIRSKVRKRLSDFEEKLNKKSHSN